MSVSAPPKRDPAGAVLMFYRSLLLRLVLAGIGMWVAFQLAFAGPRWHNSPSLHVVRELGAPWVFWAAAFAAYAVMLLSIRLRWLGYFTGMALYGFFLVSLFFTVSKGGPLNPVAIAAYGAAIVFHFAAARIAMLDQGR